MEDILKPLYKGYTWDKNRNQWMVRIYVNNKSYFLGRYKSERKARAISVMAQLYKDIIFLGQES